MNKALLLIAGLLCASSNVAWAARGCQECVTVNEAKQMHDDARVTLEGKVTGRTGEDDNYWLRDNTGRIAIDVEDCDDDKRLIGRQVRVVGNIDRDDDGAKLDADRLIRLN
ncbi:NirD/YgiW/YdeI family stress tolerance protein [Enterobacteriaceae bacterium 4M9]|nr:NirD/YgiW/YdeI family stress tolerance protein [Enterobacteriaceae bacterium 4M9]